MYSHHGYTYLYEIELRYLRLESQVALVDSPPPAGELESQLGHTFVSFLGNINYVIF